MGIFDKLKKLKNYISGSGAEIHLVVDPASVLNDGMVKIKILCQIKEHDILVDKLYVKLKAEERVRYRDRGTTRGSNHRVRHGSTKTAYATSYSEELIIDTNFRLDANGEYEWDAEFMIPSNVPGTYRGINATHEWQILAGLSKKGNDPDSGWVIFDV